MKSWSEFSGVPGLPKPFEEPVFTKRDKVYANWKFKYFMPVNG